MRHEEHCQRSRELLGQDWREAHAWLDRYERDLAGWHRILLHHSRGLELAVATLGERARPALQLHLRDDWEGHFEDIPDGPVEVAAVFTTRPNRGLAREIVAQLRQLYGQDFGLDQKWGLGAGKEGED